jgi:DNA-binding transcriptional MerR regulator/methylmalonyl-CoA mutase cobalamin-binding subunit
MHFGVIAFHKFRQNINNHRYNRGMGASYTIRAVAEQTGLTTHTIRAWERRYGLLSPDRTDSNRRLYDERDIERLRLVVRAVEGGHSLGQVARLPNDELQRLGGREVKRAPVSVPSDDFLAVSRQAMLDYDSETFQSTLRRAREVLGVDQFLQKLVVPLLSSVGEGWRKGDVLIAQEHFASAFLRSELEGIRYSFAPSPGAPRIVIATPSGQMHELGALMAAITVARHGWRATYLGPNLPAGEVAAAVKQVGARAVGLSVVFPESDLRTIGELKRLRELLGPDFPILVGGSGADSYREVIGEITAVAVSNLSSLALALTEFDL